MDKKIYLIIIIFALGTTILTLFFQSIRLDEAQSLWVSTKSFQQIIQIDLQDVLVPLYELLLHVGIQIFGDSILIARAISFLFLLFTLPVLYQLGKESGGEKVGALSVTLFSLSPFILWYSSEARMYTLFVFVTTLNHLFFLRFLRSMGKEGKFGLFVSSVVGYYTHYFFIFLLLSQIVYLFLYMFQKQEEISKDFTLVLDTRKRKIKLFFAYISILFIATLCFLPWIYLFIKTGSAANSQPLIPPPTSFNIFQALVNFLFGFQSSAVQAIFISLWPLFVLLLFFAFTARKKQHASYVTYFATMTFLPIILVFLGSFIKPIFLTRYLILVTPTLFFLIAWLIISSLEKRSGIFITGLLICMFALLLYQNISTATPTKENYSGVSQFLIQHATPSDIVAVTAPFTIYPIEYTYTGDTKLVTIPLWDRYAHGAIPPYSQQAMVAQIKDYQKQYVHLFVVFSYNQGYEKNITNYLDTHYQRLLKKDFSPGLEVREYRLRYDI